MASSFRADGQPGPGHLEEAAKLLNNPSFFSPGKQFPADLVFTGREAFHFTSPFSSPWAENNQVSGKLFRAGLDWQKRPSVILLHGWSAELQYGWQFRWLAKLLANAGVNAAMFELPYHGSRRPREPGAIQNFISYDLLQMLNATRQSLADTRALQSWLLAQGSPAVGLWGISLGAWLAGLSICSPDFAESAGLEERAGRKPALLPPTAFAVLLTPIAKVEQAIQELAFCESIRCSLQGAASVRLEPLNLASHRPQLAPEKILLVEAEYDVFAPAATVEQLWQAWGQPQIWRLPHGHISILLSPCILKRIVRWISAGEAPEKELCRCC